MSIIGPFNQYLNLKKLFPTDDSVQSKQYYFEQCCKQYDLRELVVDCMYNHIKEHENDMNDFKIQTASILKQFEIQKKSKEKIFTEQQITKSIEKLTVEYTKKYEQDK